MFRLMQSSIGKDLLKRQKKDKIGTEASVELRSANDITILIEDAKLIRYALLKDSVGQYKVTVVLSCNIRVFIHVEYVFTVVLLIRVVID